MKEKLGIQCKRIIFIMIISSFVGTALLTLAFCIPKGLLIGNVASSLNYEIRSVQEFEEGSLTQYLWGHKETYTDAIMVQNAIEDQENQNAFEQAMWVYHSDVSPDLWEPEESVKAYCADRWENGKYTHTYARYWHGYLVYLKPLLLLFSWKQLIFMGAILQLGLFVAVIILSVKKRIPGVGMALSIGLLYTKPIIMMASLTMAVCSVITLAALLVMMVKHEWLEQEWRYPEFFLIIGILTAYFDFLTYPIITLGFPLCTYFLMKKEECLKIGILKTMAFSVLWGIGYAGMWAMKWIIADLTLHTGTIKDAVWSILGRTEVIGGRPRMNGGFYTISLNLKEYDSPIYIAGVVLLAVVAAIMVAIAIRKNGLKNVVGGVILYSIIFCIPFVWIIVVQHHSALHARFTFRIISVAAMALGCIIIHAVRCCAINKNK